MKQIFISTLSAAILGSAALAGPLQIDFVNSTLSGAPGDTLVYTGTITNTSLTDTVFLNGVSATSVSAFLNFDTLPFFFNAPASLDPGQMTAPIELFDLLIDAASPAGPFVNNSIFILGGADNQSFDIQGDTTVDAVVAASSTTPEPSPALVLLFGGSLLTLFRSGIGRTLCRQAHGPTRKTVADNGKQALLPATPGGTGTA